MKKLAAFLFVFVFMAVYAGAVITVTENGQTKTYSGKAAISSKYDTVVVYNGVNIVIPQGTKVILEEKTDENGQTELSFSGKNLSNIQVGETFVNSTGKSAFVLKSNSVLHIESGNVTVTDAQGKTLAVSQSAAQAQNAAVPAETTVFFTGAADDNSYTQSKQDIVVTEDLSNSAPRI